LESLTAIEEEIKSNPITESRKAEIVSFLSSKIGKTVYFRYYKKFPSYFDNNESGQHWEIRNKIEKVLDTYIERKPDILLGAYMWSSLRRYVFKEIILKSYAYIKSEKGIMKCPVCKYDEYLELVNPFLRIYKCSHCEDIINSLVFEENSDEYYKHKTFSFFTEDGVECLGCEKIIPISALDIKMSWIDTDYAQLIINGIEEDSLPDELMQTNLKCPHCFDVFKLKDSTQKSLASTKYHRKYKEIPIENVIIVNKDNTYSVFYKNIDAVKKSNILIEELIIKLDRIEPNSFNKCLKRYLYISQIMWIKKYWNYAPDYFFHKTDILGMDIHKTMFDMWLKVIENNLEELRKFKNIDSIEDLKWFCRAPNFNSGPIDTFVVEVKENNRIKNNTNLIDLKSNKWNIRMAKVLSIDKVQNEELFPINFSENVLTMTWQDIIINQRGKLRPNDVVSVTAIMMPGHPSHAPIRALLRIRSDVLANIISKVIEEENSHRDKDFWDFRDVKVKLARINTEIDIRV